MPFSGQDPNSGRRTPNRWFNINAFQAPQPLTFGNTGRSIIIGLGVARVDVSLHKDILLRETQSLEFRTEFFNAISHRQFLPARECLRDGQLWRDRQRL
jgi:hypothetical protein